MWNINSCQPLLYVLFLDSFFFFQSSLVFLPLSNASLDAISFSFYCRPGTNKVPPILTTMTIQVCVVSEYEVSLCYSTNARDRKDSFCLNRLPWFTFNHQVKVASNLHAKTSTLCYSFAFSKRTVTASERLSSRIFPYKNTVLLKEIIKMAKIKKLKKSFQSFIKIFVASM